ncbi:hypothetical protein SAMN05421823_107158 [Catalinimonas alkaloidigena]|uniref:Uncharacterized protein n=1 Tax=Catalinimonas alkaloidigena TaxID=1075417 RepID=A0A1G9LT16_9BACT|nr:hypothetical protein [Catalinimonas alkaloidigena]SDL65109.1 hypothetical protein SAMN05421823_107158 [Catalinimonas alkaloidigena]
MSTPKMNKAAVVERYDIANSSETLHLANDVQKFITENKLFMNIQGKAYVNVEGWQYAGARLGILPVVEELLNVGDEQEIKYQAKVKLLNLKPDADGTPGVPNGASVVGTGYAICSNKENGKRFYQEFAIASMAQTRAIGKAYRNILAWIIRAAGYEPTPAEEMDFMVNQNGHTQKDERRAETAPVPAAKRYATAEAGTGHAAESTANYQPNGTAKPADAQAEKEAAGQSTDESSAKLKPASARQKADILLLLNHKSITTEEKERTVRNLNRIDSIRAQKVIVNLKKVIHERSSNAQHAA